MELYFGSVVRLKTGGPLMTVEGHKPELDCVDCVWFCKVGDDYWAGPNRDSFLVSALVEASDADKTI